MTCATSQVLLLGRLWDTNGEGTKLAGFETALECDKSDK